MRFISELNNNDLKNIEGGAVSPWVVIGVSAGIVFLIGVLDGFFRPLKCNKWFMKELNNEEAFFVEGGLSVSGTLINSFTAGIKILLELGRSLGSVIRRGGSGQMCKI